MVMTLSLKEKRPIALINLPSDYETGSESLKRLRPHPLLGSANFAIGARPINVRHGTRGIPRTLQSFGLQKLIAPR